MMELISREEAFNTIPKIIMTPPRNGKMLWAELIDKWHKNMAELPIIESRPKGKWLMENDGYTDLFKCSECGEEWAMWFDDRKPQEQGYNFCPNCGADMRGEE